MIWAVFHDLTGETVTEVDMKAFSQKTNLWLDTGLFTGFLLAFWLDMTGLSLHQWLGVALAALALYHLLLHQKWVAAVSERFFGRTSSQARRYYLLDALLMAGFTLISLSGLLISSWLGLPLNDFDILREIHVWSSILTAALVLMKIALHSGWITQALQRSFAPLRADASSAMRKQPASSDRRAFLKLVGVAGAATLIAVSQALPGEVQALAGDSVQPGSDSAAQSSPQDTTTSSTLSGACTLRCDKRCVYPGNCRRYTDSNQNGRCDLGECI
jgi:hypothetical protein